MESINVLIDQLYWTDLLDISILAFIFYWLLLLAKGTKTIQMLVGVLLLLGLYSLSSFLALDALSLLLDNVASSIVLVVLILFQADIRNALAQFGLYAFFREGSAQLKSDIVDEAIQACIAMSRKRIGALIVFEREVGLRNFVEKGTEINATPSQYLLLSIFHPTSPLHDGAVVISKQGRLLAARCVLPISMNSKLSPILGTRHRAAVGLSEETDAVILVVSEERSEISLCYRGTLIREDEKNIKVLLLDLLEGKVPKIQGNSSTIIPSSTVLKEPESTAI